MEGGGGRAFPRGQELGCLISRAGQCVTHGARGESRDSSAPHPASGMGRESPSAELGVPRCCTGIWEGKSFSWVILATVAVSKLYREAQEKQ